jgi:hypothetical protein
MVKASGHGEASGPCRRSKQCKIVSMASGFNKLTAYGGSILLVVPSVAAALDKCTPSYPDACQVSVPEPLHVHNREPSAPPVQRGQAIVGTGTSGGTGAYEGLSQSEADWGTDDNMLVVQENLRIRRKFTAPFAQLPIVTGTQVGDNVWD